MEKKTLFTIIAAVVLFLAGILVGKMLSPAYRMHQPWMEHGYMQAYPCPYQPGMAACGCNGCAMTGCPAMQADENFNCPAKKMKAHHGRYDENMQRPQRYEDMKRPQRPCPKNPEVLPPLPKSEVSPAPMADERLMKRPEPMKMHEPKPHHNIVAPAPLPQPEVDVPMPEAPIPHE